MKKYIFLFFIVFFCYQNTFAQTKHQIDSLIKILPNLKNDSTKVDVLIQISQFYIVRDLVDATKYIEYAKNISIKTNYIKGKIHICIIYGNIYWQEGLFDKAIENYQNAIKYAEKFRFKHLLAESYNDLGVLYIDQKKYNQAHDYFYRAISIYIAISDKKGKAECYNNIGEIYKEKSNYDSAIHHYQKALEIAQSMEEAALLGIICNNIGETFFAQKKYDKAIYYFEKAFENNSVVTESINLANNLNNLGRVYMILKKYDRAKEILLQAESISKEIYVNFLLENYKYQVELAELKNDWQEANVVYKKYILLQDSLHKAETIRRATELELESIFEKKELEIKAQQKKTNIEHFKEITQQRGIIFIILAILIVMVLLSFYLLKGKKQLQETHELLIEKNKEILLKTEELENQTEELQQVNSQVLYQRDNLQKSYENVQILSEIGKKITSNIDLDTIIETVYYEITKMMSTDILIIGVYEDSPQQIKIYSIELENKIPYYYHYFYEKNRPAIWCFGNQKELVMNDCEIDWQKYLGTPQPIPKYGEKPESLIYLPISQNQYPIGVLSVQSLQKNAYGQKELNFLRNIAVYIGIALENAQLLEEIKIKNIKLDKTQKILQKELEISTQQREQISSQKTKLEATLTELQTTQTELIQSEKMAVLGQVVANVAHEINTPLGAIKSSAEHIKEGLTDVLLTFPEFYKSLTETQQHEILQFIDSACEYRLQFSTKEERQIRRSFEQYLEEKNIENAYEIAQMLIEMTVYKGIEKYPNIFQNPHCQLFIEKIHQIVSFVKANQTILTAADKTSRIVFALKSYSRREQNNSKVNINLIENIEIVLTIYHNIIKQNIVLIKEYDEVPEIMGYPDQLNQVWTNLIQNAIQAMKGKGKLTISIQNRENEIVVKVSDTGLGIADDIKDHIFKPFFTTKRAGEGSGIGLDIVKKIVEKHEAQIGFDTEINVGTTFWVKFGKIN